MASILVVDDDYDGSAALAGFLSKFDHTVRHVADGQEAIMSVIEVLPDIVVLDLKMPHLGGLGFLEVLRSYLRLSNLPIILWTGYEDTAEIDQALQLGVRSVIVKSRTDFKDILEDVNRILGQSQPHC